MEIPVKFLEREPAKMMDQARAVGHFAEHLDDAPFTVFQDAGTHIAAPVLLGFAAEIALKAWIRKEGKKPPLGRNGHDLAHLFDELDKTTRRRLEEEMQDIANALLAHRHVFQDWRRPHERLALVADTDILRSALKAVVDAFVDEFPDEMRADQRLKGGQADRFGPREVENLDNLRRQFQLPSTGEPVTSPVSQ